MPEILRVQTVKTTELLRTPEGAASIDLPQPYDQIVGVEMAPNLFFQCADREMGASTHPNGAISIRTTELALGPELGRRLIRYFQAMVTGQEATSPDIRRDVAMASGQQQRLPVPILSQWMLGTAQTTDAMALHDQSKKHVANTQPVERNLRLGELGVIGVTGPHCKDIVGGRRISEQRTTPSYSIIGLGEHDPRALVQLAHDRIGLVSYKTLLEMCAPPRSPQDMVYIHKTAAVYAVPDSYQTV